MPRLSNPTYLSIRAELSGLWRHSPAFVLLNYADQYHLHQFFAFTKDLSPDAAIACRTAVTARYPSLPQQAGRALARFRQLEAGSQRGHSQPTVPTSPHRRGPRLLSVNALARPGPDLQRLAQVVLDLARDYSGRPDTLPAATSRRRHPG